MGISASGPYVTKHKIVQGDDVDHIQKVWDDVFRRRQSAKKLSTMLNDICRDTHPEPNPEVA
jgi:hypothetical protein